MKQWLRFVKSVTYAWTGIVHTLKTQRNMQIHVVIAIIVLITTWWLRIPRGDVLLVFFAIAFVFAMELVNTAIESAVDLSTSEIDSKAKQAKDAAAGAVLVAAIVAVCIGIAVFGKPLLDKLTSLF